jgi:predicted Zn-dependent protease
MTDEETAAHLSAIARHLLLHGNAEDALSLLDSAVVLAPDDATIVSLQCEAAHRAGRNDQAHERLTALMQTLPRESRVALSDLDARVLLALGRDEEAAVAYQRAHAGPSSVFGDADGLDIDRTD